MGTHQEPDIQISGNDSLLSEILGVLKRIDGHLQVQQDRIDELDTKIARVTASAEGGASLVRKAQDSNDHSLKTATSLRPFKERRVSTFPTSPSTRRKGLGLRTTRRNGSGQSAYSGISLDHSGDDEWQQGALAGQFNKQGSIRERAPAKSKDPYSPNETSNSVPEAGFVSRRGTLSSLLPPPMAQSENSDHDRHNDDLEWYTKFEPPESWIVTRTQGRRLEVKHGSEKAKSLWKEFVGDSCTVPPDGRVEMTFQQHILERLDEPQVRLLLKNLQDVSDRLEYWRPGDYKKRGSFKITDYYFDPHFEVSVAEYRADIPIGKFRDGPIQKAESKKSFEGVKTAPWKRIM